MPGAQSWLGGWDEPGVLSVVLIESNIPGSGLFVYSGQPAAGNLIASIAAAAATDSFGNNYVAGEASYAATFATAINGGQIVWYSGSLAAGWSSVATAVAHAVVPQGLVISAAAEIALVNSAGSSGLTLGTPVGPNVTLLSGAVGDITAGVPGAANTVETWHAMSPLLNSWANQAAPVVQAQYRKVASPPNSVEVIGGLNAAAATAITFFTLPAGYRPASAQTFGAVGTFSGAVALNNVIFGQCDTAGNLSIQQRTASATGVNFHGFISLDA
jgi:hypothetical protein